MKKLTLIGRNLCTVVLLILGTLSNVVGYEPVKSTINNTPLFQTRTQRAINQQQNIITTQYLGIGEKNLLQFPIRDNRTEQLKKVIDIISKMDDMTFAQFTELCIQKARQDDALRDISRSQIIQSLLILKTSPEAIINSSSIRNTQDSLRTEFTQCGRPTWCVWGPGCLLILLFWIPIFILDILGEVIYGIFTIVFTTANY